ncbi:MAG: GNAT family N-acetyltransferase [Chloroflexota bacterium]
MPDDTHLPHWGFASPGRLRDELTALALDGVKTATAGLLVEFELDGEPLPNAGERQVLLDSAEAPVAIVETTSCRVARLADVDDVHAIDEGEGYADAAAFRVSHERFWNGYRDELRRRLGDPSFVLDDDTPIVLERFRVVERLDVPPPPVASREIRRAGPERMPHLAGVLARAMAPEPMSSWPLGAGPDLARRVRGQFLVVDGAFAREGWIHEAADGLGVMALEPPGSMEQDAELLHAADEALAALTPDGGARYQAFWDWIAEVTPKEPHWFLDQLAVEPAAHGRGIGRALLEHAIAAAEADRLPLLLETGTRDNVALYERFGFRVTRAEDAPGGGPHVWFMLRAPC